MNRAQDPRPLLAAVSVGFLLLGWLLVHLPSSGSEQAPPMTDEDVVVAFISGTPVDRIIDKIRASEVAFDLSDEMIDELRAAGLPPELVRAMVERQRELDAERSPEAGPEAATEDEPGAPLLKIVLNPGWKPKKDKPRPVVQFSDEIDPQLYETLRLRGGQPRFTDLALVLLCTTQDHVPDQWRNKSPLGRDFIYTPRHRLLAFLPGAQYEELGKLSQFAAKLAVVPGERESKPKLGKLKLELPASIEVGLEANVIHDLRLGLAAQAENRYYLVASDVWEELVVPDDGLTVQAAITGNKKNGCAALGSLDVRFLPPGEVEE